MSARAWVSEYDYPARRVTLTLADPVPVGHHWSAVEKDEELSDPDGAFDVFVARRESSAVRERLFGPAIVKVVAALDDEGDLMRPHPDFDSSIVGSWSIWPYKLVGAGVDLEHWVWWSEGSAFTVRIPRPWAVAADESRQASAAVVDD